MKNYNNFIAKVLNWTGIAYILLSFVGGIVLGNVFGTVLSPYSYTVKTEFNWVIAVTSWLVGFMFSLIFFGAAEIIELLQLQNEETIKLLTALKTNVSTNVKTSSSHNNIDTFDDLPDL